MNLFYKDSKPVLKLKSSSVTKFCLMEKGWKSLVRPLGGHPKRRKACLFTSLFFFLRPEQKVLNLGLQQLKKRINATF